MSKAPVSKPEPKIEFPDPDLHTDLVLLRKDIRNVVLDLRSIVKKGEHMQTLIEFSSAIHPGSFADPGRLPYDSRNGRSNIAKKEPCLFARVSKLIQGYWDVVLNNEHPDTAKRIAAIKDELKALREVKRKGLILCKMEGDDKGGYVLV